MLQKLKDMAADKEMGFLDHLEEMRWVIIKSLIALFVCCMGTFFFFSYVNDFLLGPLHSAEAMLGQKIPIRMANFTSPIFIILYMVILSGFALAIPFTAYFVASFIVPALTKSEKKVLIPGILSAILLFFIGAAMTYYLILPLGLYFSTNISAQYLQTEMFVDAQSYYGLVCMAILGIGLSFEVPLLQVILIYLGVLKVQVLKKCRRWVIVILFTIAAIITPPDIVTQIVLALPLWLLFELALIVGAALRKKKEAAELREEQLEKEQEERERQEELRQKELRKQKALESGEPIEDESEDPSNPDEQNNGQEGEIADENSDNTNQELTDYGDGNRGNYNDYYGDRAYDSENYDDYAESYNYRGYDEEYDALQQDQPEEKSALFPDWDLNEPNLFPDFSSANDATNTSNN